MTETPRNEGNAWVCPWRICTHEQAQVCRADLRKGCGHIPDRLNALVDNLRGTQAAMRQSAALLKREGIEHAAEMEGAANIIDSWLAGIRQDLAGVNPAAAALLPQRGKQ